LSARAGALPQHPLHVDDGDDDHEADEGEHADAGQLSQHLTHARENAFEILEDLLIAETDDGQPVAFDERRAIGILLGSVLVDGTIDLDDQPDLGAVEIDNEAIDGVLTAELLSKLSLAQLRPQPLLRFGGLVAHLAGQRLELSPEFGVRTAVLSMDWRVAAELGLQLGV